MNSRVTVAAVGDVMVNRPDPAGVFTLVKPVFDAADIVFGNCESVYARSGSTNPATRGEVRADPVNVIGLTHAGFDVMSFANNHHLDSGYDAFFETMRHLDDAGIVHAGAGRNTEEARRPGIVERHGVTVAFLSYSTVMFPGYEAGPDKPGCARISVATHYAMSAPEQPGCSAVVRTFVERPSLEMVREDVAAAAEQADVVVFTPHWGIHFTPAVVADYETELARAAIDAGADAVLGHHQHILKGIQVYRNKPIFHGLGNFAVDTPTEHLKGAAVRDLQKHSSYSVRYDPEYPTYPFHPEARQTVVARLTVEDGTVTGASFVPAYIDPQGRPEPLRAGDPRFDQVAGYQQAVGKEVGFDTAFEVGDDEVRIRLS
ncbi:MULTISPECIES: CapA family protein [Pseudonocardia]|uniref:Capsule biosynthesis protein CapA n=2 Tax=Pseudonocardia TaxID=1847 RepID=A0A1Y2N1Q5_PSEAH|nr:MULTISPECIES: CapA family protein [Pseudonocardia]OSY40818.1 Capsule biosynthesis protein CapA [Pseudonocardia autotrophica]TDN71874.1 poly-gamma-glutamate synthesis protein (capsule biosynthesis protein) [Pseudonocardia autotrophica]BBG02562.1 hypothetical protein Pdca_37710 [Pseudonocardia autotrophica]GEC24621.1 hypothetical protein PSA01_16500 [Pseudonocardia saturnea]